MKRLLCCIWIVTAIGFFGRLHSVIAADSSTDAAVIAAQSWLALVDSGKYGASWDEVAQIFKSQVTKGQWIKMLNSVRSPLGKVESRTLKSAVFTRTLPGVPDGEYVVIQYDTSFAKKKSSVETITPMKEKGGRWRVSGYFIK
jgi:hypothetical protein